MFALCLVRKLLHIDMTGRLQCPRGYYQDQTGQSSCKPVSLQWLIISLFACKHQGIISFSRHFLFD